MRPAVALALLLGIAGSAPAARAEDDVRVSAVVLPQGRIDDATQIRLVITIEGSSVPDISSPRLPAMTNLTVVGGPYSARNSSFSFANGRVESSNSIVLSYYLSAKGPGAAEIPAFDVKVGNTQYRTTALHFQVEAGRSGPAPPSGRGNTGPPGTSEDEGGSEDTGDVFMQAKLGASSVWSGQPVTLEVTLYTSLPVASFSMTDVPSVTGAWADELSVPPDGARRVVTMNGRQYAAYTVARRLLVPTSSGTVTVPPFVAQIQARRASNDPFGAFFSLGRFVQLVRRTNPAKLEVRPLPEAGRPASFAGAVGSYRLKVSADRNAAGVGDAIALRATVEGTGSLQSVGPPHIALPPEVKVYDPKVVEDVSSGSDHTTVHKTWEWVVVPLAPGSLKIPAPTFAYFDSASGAYRELHGDLPEIAVHRGTATPDAGIARGEVQANGREIAFIKQLGAPLREAAPPVQKRGWFVALALLPFVLVPAAIVAGRRRERLLSDRGFARARRAARAAEKRLSRASAHAADPTSAFHEEVAGALVDYVADRANRSASGLTYDALDEILVAKKVPDDLRRRYRACLETCDFARYVPDSAGGGSRAELVGEARSVLRALEEVA